ncbi:MAG: cytochrome c [Planctomycetota bacterium]|nr:cytochrome c [Planctomycetota bacterium]
MPRWLIYLVLILIVVAMIPPALIAWARTARSEVPRIHIFQDMDAQAKVKPQQIGPVRDDGRSIFADGRGMRPPVAGTLARDDVVNDGHYLRGVVGEGWADTFPARTPVTLQLLQRGRERFDIYCAPCHGIAGYGNGIIHQRAMMLVANPALGNGTVWVQPMSLHDPTIRDQPVGQIYNTITHGIRNMAGYGPQITVEGRWAIVAYVEALQRSQNAPPEDVPAAQRQNLPVVDLMPEEEQ